MRLIAKTISLSPRVTHAKSIPERIVIITCGADSTIVAVGEREVKSYSVTPIPDVNFRDANGAGDSFSGTL